MVYVWISVTFYTKPLAPQGGANEFIERIKPSTVELITSYQGEVRYSRPDDKMAMERMRVELEVCDSRKGPFGRIRCLGAVNVSRCAPTENFSVRRFLDGEMHLWA